MQLNDGLLERRDLIHFVITSSDDANLLLVDLNYLALD
jgi:hypothetical protein